MVKKFSMCLLLLLLLSLCGCGFKETVTVYSDGRVKVNMIAYVSEDDAKPDGSIGNEVVKGKRYYKFPTTKEKDPETNTTKFTYVYYDKDDAKVTGSVTGIDVGDTGTKINANTFEWKPASASNMSSVDFYEVTVEMPKAIKRTNGKLSADNKTVTFDLTSDACKNKCYAYTTGKSNAKSNITLSGLNKQGHLTKSKTIKIKTSEAVKSIKINGKNHKSKNIKISKQGKYTIKVKTENQSKTFKFYFDKTKPTTSVKSKEYMGKVKITFKDKYSGIKSATLDGESIKSGRVCTTSGSHTLVLKDKAGNTKTVKFSIK